MEKSGKFTHERKSGVDTIKLTVIPVSSVSNNWKSRIDSEMESGKNDLACTIVRVIQIKNTFSRRVAVNVRKFCCCK